MMICLTLIASKTCRKSVDLDVGFLTVEFPLREACGKPRFSPESAYRFSTKSERLIDTRPAFLKFRKSLKHEWLRKAWNRFKQL